MQQPIPKYPEVPELTSEQIRQITNVVFMPDIQIEPCDLIFLFGGSHPKAWETTYQAYKNQLGNRILVTGGNKPGAHRHISWQYGNLAESHVAANQLISLGIPREIITIEDRSTNSLENIQFAKNVYNFENVQNLLFVCKSYAAGRQYRTLRKNLPKKIRLVPYPFDTSDGTEPVITKSNWMNSSTSKSLIFGEYLRIVLYGLNGDIEALEKPIKGITFV